MSFKNIIPSNWQTFANLKAETGDMAFPVTLEAFTARQRAQLGRDFSCAEMKLFQEIVDMSNEAYEAAAKGDVDAVAAILKALITTPATDPYTRHVIALCRGWVIAGAAWGADVLRASFDGPPLS